MFSIDQNSHSLWDAPAKVQALGRHGVRVRHFVEDVDVAFTALGSGLAGAPLRLARERFYRGGGSDWGAAMFYAGFLSPLPVEIRDWEGLTGMKTDVLARSLGRTVDDLYEEFSPSGTWQFVGPSYVGDKQHHRVIGDLSVAETAPWLARLLDKARADMLRCFPDAGARGRLEAWFAAERARVDRLIARHAGDRLVELYRGWMAAQVGEGVEVGAASALLACGADETRTALLEVFLRDYDRAAGLYNQAVAAADGLRKLRTADGELPFFALLDHRGHRVRTGVWLDGRRIRIGERTFDLASGRRLPIDALKADGVRCLSGKAALLVIQVRIGPAGEPLALPYRGSPYMPAAFALERKLYDAGLLLGEVRPVVRVRLRLLDRLASLDTVIRLPWHLAAAFGRGEIPARELAAGHAGVAADAAGRLEVFRTAAGREKWQTDTFPGLTGQIGQLDARRRRLARADAKSEELRAVWKQLKAARVDLLDRTLRQIARDWQVSQVGYWDSRGAVLPWCIALGGESFYDEVIANAEIYEEPAP